MTVQPQVGMMIEVRKRIRELIVLAGVIISALIVLNILLWAFVPFGFVSGIILSLGTIGITVWLIWRGIYTVGTETPPRMALRIRFGQAIDAAMSGLYFRLWLVDRIVRFWTTPYTLDFTVPNVYSKHGPPEFAAQSMTVGVTFAFSWPRPGESYETGQKDAAGNPITMEGGDLLDKARRALPFDPETVTTEQLGDYLLGSIADAIINIMAKFNHEECRESREKIEEMVKDYLVEEPGNIVGGLGIPMASMDIQITSMEIPADTQQAMRDTEIAYRRGEQTKIRAAAEAEAAPKFASALKDRLGAYVDRNVSADIAAFADRGERGGDPLTPADMRDIFITRALGGVTGGQEVPKLTIEGFVEWFADLSPENQSLIGGYVQSQ